MSADIWVISDTHFNHANIIKFTDSNTGELIRGSRFSSTKEMDDHMIDRWNATVKPGDKVYHLGDVVFGDKDYFQKNSFAKEGGFVHAEQILASKNNEFHTEVMQHIQGVIADCLQRGYKYSDIAILTRKNSIASNIADELMSMGIPVVSSESLLLHKNPHVDLLISLLQLGRLI